MPTIRLIHWKAVEAQPLLARLREAGHLVDYAERAGPGLGRLLRERRPDALVIDLSRLPSRGKAVAEYMRRTKATFEIPLLFHGGVAAKVAAVRALFPDAVYAAEPGALVAALRVIRKSAVTRAVGGGIANPERTAAQKLGIAAGATVSVLDAPRDYTRVIGAVAAGVEFLEEERPTQALTLWFVHEAGEFEARLAEARNWARRTKLWVLWRKQASGRPALTQFQIRRMAGVFGLVDHKICAVDETWSGMLFSLRK